VIDVNYRPRPLMWIGLDPALSAFGYAVMGQAHGGKPELLDLGVWHTEIDKAAGSKPGDTTRRVREQLESLRDLFQGVRPDVVFVESLVLIPRMGVYANMLKGRLRGGVEGLVGALEIPLHEYSPQEVRRHLGLERGAEKSEVAAAVRRLHPSSPAESDENATDAAAVAILGGWSEHVDWHRRQLARRLEAVAEAP